MEATSQSKVGTIPRCSRKYALCCDGKLVSLMCDDRKTHGCSKTGACADGSPYEVGTAFTSKRLRLCEHLTETSAYSCVALRAYSGSLSVRRLGAYHRGPLAVRADR